MRYPAGSDLLGLITGPIVKGGTPGKRAAHFFRQVLKRPRSLGVLQLRQFAKSSIILLFMQSSRTAFDLVWRRSVFFPLGKMRTTTGTEAPPPSSLSIATKFTEEVADEIGGIAKSGAPELLGMSFTAHILGGCKFESSQQDGVIDHNHEVFGYPGLFVVGGSAVPVNPGANPALTIAAMAERAMAKIPKG